MNKTKTAFWFILCLLWVTPEAIQMYFTKKVSKIGTYLANKAFGQ